MFSNFSAMLSDFLDAFSHLYKRVCLSIRPSVCPYDMEKNREKKAIHHAPKIDHFQICIWVFPFMDLGFWRLTEKKSMQNLFLFVFYDKLYIKLTNYHFRRIPQIGDAKLAREALIDWTQCQVGTSGPDAIPQKEKILFGLDRHNNMHTKLIGQEVV